MRASKRLSAGDLDDGRSTSFARPRLIPQPGVVQHGPFQSRAEAERINPSYIARVLRLTLLAPDIVEAILDGRQPVGLQLDNLLAPFPVEWERQREALVDGIEAEQRSRKEREPAD